jgi:pimeloyl-ACP methyl ester carboxylesterase
VSLRAGFNLATVDLEVGFEDKDEDEMAKRVVADGMLTHVGPIDISRKLLKRLRTCENALSKKLRVHNYGYDWRLSPHRISRDLISFLERLPCNSASSTRSGRGATVIAHSLGGLITRHAVNQRPDLFAGVIYAGVPDGCVNILGPFRRNDDVLFSPRIFSYQVTFSVRTSFLLLPANGRCFIDMASREELPVDFFNVDDWVKYRFSPCLDPPLPASLQKTGLLNTISSSISIPRSVGGIVGSLPFMKRKPSRRTPPSGEKPTVDPEPVASEKEPTAPRSPVAPLDAASKAVPRPLSREAALAYLARTLAATKRFRRELAHRADLAARDAYPPLAVLYGKTEPTVRGARVRGGRAAMPPEGYRAARGGVVGSDRGHIALLGDLEAVGRCLLALGRARRMGAGLGAYAEGFGQAGE